MAYIAENPLAVAVILFLVGVLLGWFMSGGRRRELHELRRAREEWDRDRMALLSTMSGSAVGGQSSSMDAAREEFSGKLEALEDELHALREAVDAAAGDDVRIDALIVDVDEALRRAGVPGVDEDAPVEPVRDEDYGPAPEAEAYVGDHADEAAAEPQPEPLKKTGTDGGGLWSSVRGVFGGSRRTQKAD